MRPITFFAILSMATIVNGQSLKVDKEHEPHRLIVAEFQVSPQTDVVHELTWILPSGVDSIEVGNSIVMAAPPRKDPYQIMLIAMTKRWGYIPREGMDDQRFVEDATVRVFQNQFVVKGDITAPPEPPTPPEPPDPIPDGTYGLIRKSYEWALLVPVEFRKKAINEIAQNFAAAARSNAIPSSALEKLRLDNRIVLPDPSDVRDAWMNFFTPWSQYMSEMLGDGRLANITSAHQKAFDETRQGLERAAKEQQ